MLENREIPYLSAKLLVDLAQALGVTIQDMLGEPPSVKASAEDLRFFRKYIAMSQTDKDWFRNMIELLEPPTAKRAGRGRSLRSV